jgi:putative phage-type endonuclease
MQSAEIYFDDDLVQGSEEWLEKRRTRITATDAGVILGVSPYGTPLSLWKQKLGFMDQQKDNEAMRKGRELEPIARTQYEFENSALMRTTCVFRGDWLMASLDGIDPDREVMLEIKTGYQTYKDALNNHIPLHYYAQMQHSLYVSGAKICHYYVYKDEKEKPILMKVHPDEKYMKVLLEKERDFYERLVNQDAPDISAEDYIEIDTPEFLLKAERWKATQEKLKAIQEEDKRAREELLDETDGGNCMGAGLKITQDPGRKTVDWKTLALKHNIPDEDIKEHTKCGVPFARISLLK